MLSALQRRDTVNGDNAYRAEDNTYMSLLGAIFKNRRLRIESEHNEKAKDVVALCRSSSLFVFTFI
jgi:hypothetical protein